jgi:hypothetical protein
MENDWSSDLENILESIRTNCSVLSEEHRKQYFIHSDALKYFRIPIIVISGVNSVISVGFQTYMPQKPISLINCILALICSIVGSVELYLGVQKKLESELMSSREYYLLGIDIQKTLLLTRDKRPVPARDYLTACYNTYVKLFENSNVLHKKVHDKLMAIEGGGSPKSSVSSSFSNFDNV